MRRLAFVSLVAPVAALAMAGCTTPTGPVEVTRFVSTAQQQRLGSGPIFVEAVAEQGADPEVLRAFQGAVARELVRLGYRETARDGAAQIAQVRLSQGITGTRRSPVTVGGGGSVGSYGSGAGIGIGINLGRGNTEKLSTRLEVRINDAASGQSLWEGRAAFDVASSSLLADSAQNASVMAEALFRSFPGNDGETVQIDVVP